MRDHNQPDWQDDTQLHIEDLDPPEAKQARTSLPWSQRWKRLPRHVRLWITGGIFLCLVFFLLFLLVRPAEQAAILTPRLFQQPSQALLVEATTRQAAYILDLTNGTLEAVQTDDGSPIWQFHATLPLRPPVILVGSTLYGAAFSGQRSILFALHADTGQVVWQYPLSGMYPASFFVQQDTLYLMARQVNTGQNNVFALRLRDGSLLWQQQPDTLADILLSVEPDAVYLNTFDGSLLEALRTRDGSLLWKASDTSSQRLLAARDGVTYIGSGEGTIAALQTQNGKMLWRYSGATDGLPPFADGVTYLYSSSGAVDAVRLRDGARLWRYQPQQPLFGQLSLVGNILYANRTDGAFVALQPETGALLWHDHLTSAVVQLSPSNLGLIYVDTADGYCSALQASTGRVQWRFPVQTIMMDQAAIQEVGQQVYVAAQNGTLYAFEATTGKLLWRQTDLTEPPAIQNGRIYVSIRDGSVYTLNALTGAKLWHISPSS